MRLRELRNKSGLTQNEIANKLSVSGQTILNWENGIYEPKIYQLIQLADLFNVSVDYLIERKNNEKSVDDICKELEKISKEEFLHFIRTTLANKWLFIISRQEKGAKCHKLLWYIFGEEEGIELANF